MREFPALFSSETCLDAIPRNTRKPDRSGQDPSNRLAWERFVAIYQPVIYRIAIARGLQDADAHNLTQQILMAVATAIPRWERSSLGAFPPSGDGGYYYS
jgi:DNA-directed RNA polymerase specialized sigma24 family protein